MSCRLTSLDCPYELRTLVALAECVLHRNFAPGLQDPYNRTEPRLKQGLAIVAGGIC
jgi:hypothetical protein